MKIALFGDIHGYWTLFNSRLREIEEQDQVEFVLQTGDASTFMAVDDLRVCKASSRTSELGSYNSYVSSRRIGSTQTPVHFIGGNHEAWNRLEDHTPEIGLDSKTYYTGRSGIKTINGIRIAFVSGIHSPNNYYKQRPAIALSSSEPLPKRVKYYTESDIEYVISSADKSPDILITHDWPDTLLKATNKHLWPERWGGNPNLSPPLGELVRKIKPKTVVCGHMHYRLDTEIDGTRYICLSVITHGKEYNQEVIEIVK